jgi:murein DD-endopeptidase MepM/ murein hydrolase activator NlpD
LIVNAQAIPKWRDYMAANKGARVEHQSPVVGDSVVTSGFGPRVAPTRGASTDHKGIDLGARGGDATPDIVASASGIVLFSGRKQGYGETVMIGHADGSYTLYAHLSGHKMPAVGSEVKQGQQIGIMDRTGTATGIHLHYEQRKGTEALVPRIAGVTLTQGTRVAGAKPATDNRFAGLADPAQLPKLPVSTADGQTPPVAFARVTTIDHGSDIKGIRLF